MPFCIKLASSYLPTTFFPLRSLTNTCIFNLSSDTGHSHQWGVMPHCGFIFISFIGELKCPPHTHTHRPLGTPQFRSWCNKLFLKIYIEFLLLWLNPLGGAQVVPLCYCLDWKRGNCVAEPMGIRTKEIKVESSFVFTAPLCRQCSGHKRGSPCLPLFHRQLDCIRVYKNSVRVWTGWLAIPCLKKGNDIPAKYELFFPFPSA